MPGLSLVPATIDLAGAEVHLLSRTGREHVLARALLPVLDDYDVVLIDCPPSLGVLTINGLTAAEAVIVPMQCEALSNRGVGQLLETIEDVRQFANEKLRVLGVIATMFDSRTTLSRQVLREVEERYGLPRLRAAGPEVGALRRGTRIRPLGAPACTDLRRARVAYRSLSTSCLRRHAERLTWRATRRDKPPDPLGKRALFWVPRPSGRGPDGEPGRRSRFPLGKRALFSGAPPDPDDRVMPSRATRWPSGAPSPSSASGAARRRASGPWTC